MSDCEYENIQDRLDGDYIRLLTLAPSTDPQAPIHVRLSVTKLDESDGPVYEALSYCWGDASNRRSIFCGGQPFSVTANLESALRHLRPAEEERVLWIDAICINQNDIAERAHQVNLMRYIYRAAVTVLIWLGEEDEDSDLIFPLCERMVRNRLALLTEDAGIVNRVDVLWGPNKDQFLKEKLAEVKRRQAAEAKSRKLEANEVSDSNSQASGEKGDADGEAEPDDVPDATSKESAAFLRLISRPWFTRCWVLQEVCLAREAIIVCGTKALDWDIFHFGFTLAVFLGDSALEGRPEQIVRGGLIMMMLTRLRLQYPDAYSQSVDLLSLLWQVLPLQATDPRDKVYSILGLLTREESEALGIAPDYTISVEECYKRTALAVMSNTRNLDILLTDRMVTPTLSSPSWVPDWTLLEQPAPVGLVRDADRENGEDATVRPFRASTIDHWEPRLKPGTDSLVLSGYEFDRIIQLGDVLTVPKMDHVDIDGMTSSVNQVTSVIHTIFTGLGTYFDTLIQWERLALSSKYRKYPTGEDPETAFAITMCAGNVPNGEESALEGYRKWRKTFRGPKMFTFLKGLGMNGAFYKWMIATTGILSGFKNLGDRVYSTATETTLYRRLARTEKGYLAAVPRQSAIGDQIMLFRGGKMPLVVRPKPDGGENIMGPCYVHGIMYGEAWNEALCKDVEIV